MISASEAAFDVVEAKTHMFHADEVSATVVDSSEVHNCVEAHVISVSKTSTNVKVEPQLHGFTVDEVSATVADASDHNYV